MLELFARRPDVLQVAEGSHLTPLPVEEDLSSLSAILMDDDYYHFILAGRSLVGGLPVVDAAHLVPLKARAWLDLSQRMSAGERIDSKTIKKHKNDVFRLYQLLDPTVDLATPEKIKTHMRQFITKMAGEELDLKSLGIRFGTRDSLLADLANIYRLG